MWSYGTDMYSMGGVLLYLATGIDPWLDPISDIDEVRSTTEQWIRETNPAILDQNEGVVQIIARCLRDVDGAHPRTQSPESLRQDIDIFFPPKRDPQHAATALVDIKSSIDKLSTPSQTLFGAMASVRVSSMQRDLNDMARGSFQIAGDHERIVASLSQMLSVLSEGDEYLTVSVPSFWHPLNIGVDGPFHTVNRLLAKQGVSIRRVIVVTNKDKSDPEFLRIMATQKSTFEEFQKSHPKQQDEKHEKYYCGVVDRTEEERQELLSKGHHFGLWAKSGQELLVVPYYVSRLGPIAGVRFWACPPGNTKDRRKVLDELLVESTSISAWMASQCSVVVATTKSEAKSPQGG